MRTFWIGAPMHGYADYDLFIAPRRIDWMAEIIEQDPILRHAVIHIEEVSMSATEHISTVRERGILLGQDRVPESYLLEGYQIYGSEVLTSTMFTYVPNDPDAGFFVDCGQVHDRSRLSLCVVYATYAPDDLIRLKARLYFPPDPSERPTYFRDLVHRMREFALCLDVTEGVFDVRAEHPTLSECETDFNS